MKCIPAIFFVALMAPMCRSASISKRETNEAKKFVETMKGMITELKPMVEAVVRDIPSSEEYSKYKTKWEILLKKYNGEKVGDECLEKILDILEPFADFIDETNQGDGPAEAKLVQNLFGLHGLRAFAEKLEPVLENLSIPDGLDDIEVEC